MKNGLMLDIENLKLKPEIIDLSEFQRLLRQEKCALICTKKWDNNKKLENLLGITRSYFNEIIIIPSGEPESKELDNISQNLKLEHIQELVVIGGGSSIDSAKMLAILTSGSGRCSDYEFGKRKIPQFLPSIIGIPTTMGSGSEASVYTVINNSDTERKFTLTSPVLIPQKVLFQPELCLDLPDRIMVSSGMDAFIQAYEAFFSTQKHPIVQNIAPTVMHGILNYLCLLRKDKHNIQLIKKMQEFAFLSGICINYSRTGLVHTISVSLAKYFSQLHGELNSIILPYVIDYNRKYYHIPEFQLNVLAKLFRFDSLDSFLDYLISYVRRLNLKLSKKAEINIDDVINRIQEDQGLSIINPTPLNEKNLKCLVRKIIKQ